jgi:curved DNA-binding protein CbpA
MSHLYGILGVSPKADRAAVKSAFRSLAKRCHPDMQGGDELRFKEVANAYATLVNPTRRAAYDAQCALLRARGRRQVAAVIATMAASFGLTLGSGMAVAGWLLGA